MNNDYYTRMYLVSEGEYNMMKEKHIEENEKPKDIVNALNEIEKKNLPPDIKNTLQTSVFTKGHQSNEVDEEKYNGVQTSIESKWIENTINSLPISYQKSAKLIYDFIRSADSNTIDYDRNTGEIYVDGNLIKQSNIVNLIHYMTLNRKLKTMKYPNGIKQFVSALQKLNPPHMMFGRVGKNLIKVNKQDDDDDEDNEIIIKGYTTLH